MPMAYASLTGPDFANLFSTGGTTGRAMTWHGIPQSQSQYEELGVAGLGGLYRDEGLNGYRRREGMGREPVNIDMRDMPPASPATSPILSYAAPNVNAHGMSKGAVPMGIMTNAGSRRRQNRAVGMDLRPGNRSFPSSNPPQSRVPRPPVVKRDKFICACAPAQPSHVDMELGGGSSCSGNAWLSVAGAGTMRTQRSSGSGKGGSCGTPVASTMNEATGGAGEGGLPAGARSDFTPSSNVEISLHRKSRMFKWRRPVLVAEYSGRGTDFLGTAQELVAKAGASRLAIKVDVIAKSHEDFMKAVDEDRSQLAEFKGADAAQSAITIGAKLGTALAALIPVIDKFASAHPLLNVSWTVLSSVYKVAQNQMEQDGSVLELIESMGQMAGAASACPDLLKIAGTTDVIEEIGRAAIEVARLVHDFVQPSIRGKAKFLASS
ncbi:hypothetical protein FIBSPDRAFT_967889 [Athelia psychrophila]|uniref:Uncharacterized protein n=1 Tax=Athelia psychrophila TaxID=1759441 RepID=A0A167V7R4_9AGAM|nr:hypothetical protein FIBSPDRAFT_967889 [Fibularhizoctonia sp. CBS 109695]